MKVFNKGQVVIPAQIRRALGIEIGDSLEVRIDADHACIQLSKPAVRESAALAGSLARYAARRAFPTKRSMRRALAQGLSRE
jgi:AbrB family looped-hinge helix DNA binding protein